MLNTDRSITCSACIVTKTPGHLLQGRAQLASQLTGVLAWALYPCTPGLTLQPQPSCALAGGLCTLYWAIVILKHSYCNVDSVSIIPRYCTGSRARR